MTDSSRRRPLSVWELPTLLKPMHEHRRKPSAEPKERKHFAAILAFVYRNRFAVAAQIQRRFPDHLKSGRTTRRHLAELQDLGFLDTVATANTSPLWPKTYFVTGKGVKRLREAYRSAGKEWSATAQDRKRTHGDSASHTMHELFVTEFLISVWEQCRNDTGMSLLDIQRRSLAQEPRLVAPNGRTAKRLKPDGMFVIKREKGMLLHFLEVDTGSMSLTQVEAKLRCYERWADSEQGERFLLDTYAKCGAKRPRPQFRLMFVCGGYHATDGMNRVKTLARVLQHQPSAIRRRTWLTSTALLAAGTPVLDSKPWISTS